MTEEQIKNNIAKNLIDLRKRKNFTQSELAEILNYSDKSVSKWERGDGTPDVFVLYKISELFDVSINDLIGEQIKFKKKDKRPSETKRIIIPLLSVGLVFFISSIVFLLLKLIVPTWDNAWLIFVFAIPIACIPLIVFTTLWWGLIARFSSVSALVWSITISVFLALNIDGIGLIFIASGIFQLLVVLWFIMLYRSKKKLKNTVSQENSTHS